MKRTDLQIFYQLATSLHEIHNLSVGASGADVLMYLHRPQQSLEVFLRETQTDSDDGIPLSDSRAAAEALLTVILRIARPMYADPRITKALTPNDIAALCGGLKKFESEFARECRDLHVFIVTQKGLFSSEHLIEKAEKQFPANLLKMMPQQTIDDLRQAGRCLAFEVPTACAFHICRGTEALMLKYYEALAGQSWPLKKRDWGIYNEHLIKHGAPQTITSRLDEIRKSDRNAYAHPDINVRLEDAPVIFNLCNAVIHFMAKEIEALQSKQPAKP